MLRRDLTALGEVLDGQNAFGNDLVENALNGNDDELVEFLESNELWGGAGSIADQSGVINGTDRTDTRKIEYALIRLGKTQMKLGVVNVRTKMWTSAFRMWRRRGI